MEKRLIVVPLWAGTPESVWYPWLKKQLAVGSSQPFRNMMVLDMPNPDAPIIETWVTKIAESVGHDESEIARTVLVGHSVSCRAILKYLTTLPIGAKVMGTLHVAGWWTVDEPWDTLRSWLEMPIDIDHARLATIKSVVLLSDNDPFTADYTANKRTWEEKLKAVVKLVPGAGHFNGEEEPSILEVLIGEFG